MPTRLPPRKPGGKDLNQARTSSGPAKPTALAELLESAQTEAARYSGAAITPNAWQAAVGPRIAARTRVGRLARGTLTIYAATATWANELTFLAHDIVRKLQRSGLAITNIRFQIKDLGPAPAPHQTGRKTRPARAVPRATLPASLQERLASVDDPELRKAIAEAAALCLAAYDRSNA